MTHTMRRTQLVSPFGVGAMMEVSQEAFVCLDTARWDERSTIRIEDSELSRRLRRDIRVPKAGEDAPGVPVFRFPRWLFCPSCRALHYYPPAQDEANNFKAPKCEACKLTLSPMGFVAACAKGHLQDVDWFAWAHRNSQRSRTGPCSRQTAKLRFDVSGKSGGDWDALEVKCECGGGSDFVGLVGGGIRRDVMPCEGRQPWQREKSKCDESVVVFRRGASSLYHPRSVNALDLLPQGGAASLDEIVEVVKKQSWFDMLYDFCQLSGGFSEDRHWPSTRKNAEKLAIDHDWSFDDVKRAVAKACTVPASMSHEPAPPPASLQDQIMAAEWPVLARHTAASSPMIDLRPQEIPGSWPPQLREKYDGITLVRRLREVRALIGFRRISPDSDSPMVEVDLGAGKTWLPGIEVWGEGIFVWLNEEKVTEWETRVTPIFQKRAAELAALCGKRDWSAELLATARFVMLHTLSHVLIRRLSFDAGYSAASIRERVYAQPGPSGKAGILLYTADSDAEGSLGGLVRMGTPERLLQTIRNSLLDASWCSADPVCRETPRQGVAGSNGAACHACSLVSETSCVTNNCLLDRRLLLKDHDPDLGFFNSRDLL